MSNKDKRPWYKDPKIIIPAIIPIITIIIGTLFTLWMSPRTPDFRISVSPLTGQTHPGGIEQTMVTVKHIYKYKYPVTLSTGEHSTGLRVTFMPVGEPSRPYSSTMTVDVGSDVKEGAYTVEIIGIGGDGKEHTCKYVLNIKPVSVTEETAEITTKEEVTEETTEGVEETTLDETLEEETVEQKEPSITELEFLGYNAKTDRYYVLQDDTFKENITSFGITLDLENIDIKEDTITVSTYFNGILDDVIKINDELKYDNEFGFYSFGIIRGAGGYKEGIWKFIFKVNEQEVETIEFSVEPVE